MKPCLVAGSPGRRISALFVAIACGLALLACAAQRDRDSIRQGLLVSGLRQQAFVDVWGVPARTWTMTGEDRTEAGWGGTAGFFFRGKTVYDVWDYPSRGVTLVFGRGVLATWKTDKTTSELRSKD